MIYVARGIALCNHDNTFYFLKSLTEIHHTDETKQVVTGPMKGKDHMLRALGKKFAMVTNPLEIPGHLYSCS